MKESILDRKLPDASGTAGVLSNLEAQAWRRKNTCKDAAYCSRNNVLTTQTPILQNPQSDHCQAHICWICQEDLSSEARFLEHYENHMTSV